MYKNVFRKKLSNGLILLVQPLPDLSSVSVGLQILTGSREESPQEAGLSHMIEHMLFQGTSRRSMRELSRVVNAVGGQIDACTGRESTVIYSKVPSDYFGLAIDVLSDMVLHPLMRSNNLEKEKAVIAEEIRMVDDSPDELIHDLFLQALWTGQPLGRSILGSKKNLNQFNRKMIFDFMTRYYQPRNMILAIAGKVTISQATRLTEKVFNHISNFHSEIKMDKLKEVAQKSIWKKRAMEQVHLCLGVKTFPYSDSRRLAVIALSTILGGGTNSRLFYEIREKRGISYNIYSFSDCYRDAGLLGVYAACHPQKLEESIAVIKKQIKQLMKKGVTGLELSDVKEQLKGNLKISLETSSSHMWNMLQHETYLHRHPNLSMIIKEIDKLKKSDLQQVAYDIFAKQKLTSVVLGSYKQKLSI